MERIYFFSYSLLVLLQLLPTIGKLSTQLVPVTIYTPGLQYSFTKITDIHSYFANDLSLNPKCNRAWFIKTDETYAQKIINSVTHHWEQIRSICKILKE